VAGSGEKGNVCGVLKGLLDIKRIYWNYDEQVGG
jgi:hypothetical protein